ncbi:MAG: SsrA-binding protein SmpB [Planctomycetaceae bacterium]
MTPIPGWSVGIVVRHDYEILDTLECGIQLRGSEVKSIRNNKISIEEAYARVQNNEVWLLNADISEYPQATVMNHEPRRERKLLLKKREINKFAETAQHDGLTLVPLQVHFNRGLVKVMLAIAKGRKLHDKRDKLKTRSDQREIRNAMRQ